MYVPRALLQHCDVTNSLKIAPHLEAQARCTSSTATAKTAGLSFSESLLSSYDKMHLESDDEQDFVFALPGRNPFDGPKKRERTSNTYTKTKKLKTMMIEEKENYENVSSFF